MIVRAFMLVMCLGVMTPSCGGAPAGAGPVRFFNADPVWKVDDRRNIPKPYDKKYLRSLYQVDGYIVRRITRKLDFPKKTRATNVNSMDEVPDSTWFTNRIGVRHVTPEEIKRGPATDEGPENHKPWRITGAKVGGTAVGFLMKDARGRKYLLKFDKKKFPEMETGADVIIARLLWAVGYNVPEDDVVSFKRSDLVVSKKATMKNVFGEKTPMTNADLDKDLKKVFKDDKGVYRGLVSRYLPGIPISGYPRGGTRKDDPNDVVKHENRRELRGQWAIFSWLNHTDLQEDNTLDVWIEDKELGRRYVKHYLIDFGKALGVMAFLNRRPTVGYANLVDSDYAFLSLFTFGLWKRPWEGQSSPLIRGVGVLDSKTFKPGKWRENSPYWPYVDRDRFDSFWGAKLVIRFTRKQIRAAVQTAQFTDPRATPYMTQVLLERARMVARYWFARVNPLDGFVVERSGSKYRLCFDDLMLKHELRDVAASTRYLARGFGYDGKHTGFSAEVTAGKKGHVCLAGFEPGPQRDGYLILRLVTRRGGRSLPPTLVHLAKNPKTGTLRLIGLRRY